MLDWFKGAAREPGFLGFYRMLAQLREGSRPADVDPVRHSQLSRKCI
jgi:hypothetical protein